MRIFYKLLILLFLKNIFSPIYAQNKTYKSFPNKEKIADTSLVNFIAQLKNRDKKQLFRKFSTFYK